MFIRFYILLLLLFFTVSCSQKLLPVATENVNKDFKIDYSKLENWSAHPYKKDFSDSTPKPLHASLLPDSLVDVFYIHPTTYLNEALVKGDTIVSPASPLWNASLMSATINRKTDESPTLYQASIFNAAGRLFAPRYRQANYYAYFSKDTLLAQQAFELAYQDVKQAFEYYLANYNNGRPIVIAAHSQGSTHGKRLLKEFFDGKPLMAQLVVAYLVGMPVEKGFFSAIPVCASPQQTGCFCSWRTFREGYLTSYLKSEIKPAWVTNPLSWDTSGAPVARTENKGAVLLNFNKVLPATTGGRIYNNVLWVNKPKVFGSFLLKNKNYHIGDLNLFYVNVRENVQKRIAEFKRLNVRNSNLGG